MPNLALLPVPQSAENLRMAVEENFRRIATLFAQPIPAASITPGSLPTGNWIADGSFTILNAGLELYQAGSTPYIDFHRAANPAGDANADYDIRLINEANDYLVMYGGTFKCPGGFDVNGNIINGTVARNHFKDSEQSSGTGLRVGAAWGIYGIYSEWGSVVVGCGTGNVIYLNIGGSPDSYIDANGLTIHSRNYIGQSGAYGSTFAQFSHSGFWNSSGYGFMQENSGQVYLSCASGTLIYFRVANTTKMLIGGSSIECYARLALYDETIRSRTWNDDWHMWGWWSGNDGLRITEYGGLYFRVRDQDPALEILATGVSRFKKFDQIGAYDTSAIVTKSDGGGTGAKVGFWSAGQNAAQILKCWGSTIEGRTWDDGGWGTINAVLNNMSTRKGKENIKDARQLLNTRQRRTKQKKTRTVHYNRLAPPKGWCANCVGTGRWIPKTGESEETCPYCHGDPMSLPAPAHHTKSEESGWFGFIAEEIVEEFPEAVFYKEDFDGTPPYPVGLDSLALIAILWEDNKDQQEEIDALETRISDLENKK